jgi:hypothetical protein
VADERKEVADEMKEVLNERKNSVKLKICSK